MTIGHGTTIVRATTRALAESEGRRRASVTQSHPENTVEATLIQGAIFDLDGTLVQTEKLKALSYARAAVQLRPRDLDEETVVEAFKDVVGRPRREVAVTLMNRFGLEEAARARLEEYGVQEPWQAYVQVRLEIYHEMLEKPEVLQDHRWPHALDLLETVRERGCRTGLATMSHCDQARHVLTVLGLEEAFDFVATRDDVEHGKPDPEIYLLVCRELDLPPDRCIVIEDSPAGVEAALAAGTHVVAVSTPFSRERLHQSELLPPDRIVDDPDALPELVARVFQEAR